MVSEVVLVRRGAPSVVGSGEGWRSCVVLERRGIERTDALENHRASAAGSGEGTGEGM